MTLKCIVLAGLVLLSGAAQTVTAQTPSRPAKPASSAAQKADANAWTVGLAGGLLEGTFIRYAADLAKVLDDGDKLRVIPMVTFGAIGNVSDLLNLTPHNRRACGEGSLALCGGAHSLASGWDVRVTGRVISSVFL